MSLSKDVIADAALEQVQEAGLASLSMRGLATALGVRPGALYWHVESKQELLALVAERILDGEPFRSGIDRPGTTRSAARLAADLRTSLAAVRDGADIVSFASALHPERSVPVEPLRRAMVAGAASGRSDREIAWAAKTLVHFVVGAVAEEQNRSELHRAGVLPGDERGHGDEGDAAGDHADTAAPPEESRIPGRIGAPGAGDAAFDYGVRIILRGAGLDRGAPLD